VKKLLSLHDQMEIDKFELYLRAIARWDAENDTLPDFAPIGTIEAVEWGKKQAKAQAAIYKQIYGEEV
jgi:hypothetical protein